MKILILFGTTEGQTRKICEFVAARLESFGDVVALSDASGATNGVDLRDYDAAIVAASLHAGQYQDAIVEFARAHRSSLERLPSAFLSVSLMAASADPEDLKGVAACAERFKAATGWTHADVRHVAGAFRFTEYDFFKNWVMKLIAWERKIELVPGKDLELTNWGALAEVVDALRAGFAAHGTAHRAR